MYSQSSGYLFLAWLTKEMMQSIKSHVSCPLWWSWTASSKLDSLEDWQLDKRHKFLPFYRKKLVVFWAQKLFLVCLLADKHKVVLRVVVMGGGVYEYNCGVVQWGSRATEMIWRVYSSAAFGQLDLFIFFLIYWGREGGNPFETSKVHKLSGARDSPVVSYTLLSNCFPNCCCLASVTAWA